MEVMCFGINPSNENLSKYIRLMHVMYVEKYQQINKWGSQSAVESKELILKWSCKCIMDRVAIEQLR